MKQVTFSKGSSDFATTCSISVAIPDLNATIVSKSGRLSVESVFGVVDKPDYSHISVNGELIKVKVEVIEMIAGGYTFKGWGFRTEVDAIKDSTNVIEVRASKGCYQNLRALKVEDV